MYNYFLGFGWGTLCMYHIRKLTAAFNSQSASSLSAPVHFSDLISERVIYHKDTDFGNNRWNEFELTFPNCGKFVFNNDPKVSSNNRIVIFLFFFSNFNKRSVRKDFPGELNSDRNCRGGLSLSLERQT